MSATALITAPSYKQIRYFNSLMTELTGTEYTQGFAQGTTKAEASQAISAAKQAVATKRAEQGQPEQRRQPRTVDPATVSVPDGRYAIRSRDGQSVRFFKVSTGREGTRWAGFRFLDEQHGGDFSPVRDREFKASVLRYIAKDVYGAATLYGTELGVCGMCGKTLTDDASRAMGIGPDCFEKVMGRRRTRAEEQAAIAGNAVDPGQPVERTEPVAPVVERDPGNEAEARLAAIEHADHLDSLRGAASGILAEQAPALLDRLASMVSNGHGLTVILDGLREDESVGQDIMPFAIDYVTAACKLRRSAGQSTIGRNVYGF